MFTFHQYITEVLDVKPKVTFLRTSQHGGNYIHHFDVDHPALKTKVRVSVEHYGPTEAGSMDIHGKNMGYEHIGHLGIKNVMHVIGRIKHHLPSHITTLDGQRLTGSHIGTAKKSDMRATVSSISIKHVKPIPPDNE